MSDSELNRWSIANQDITKFTVTISDSQSKRKKTYHIPYLTHAVIKNHLLLVATSLNKIMEINLINESRRFI